MALAGVFVSLWALALAENMWPKIKDGNSDFGYFA